MPSFRDGSNEGEGWGLRVLCLVKDDGSVVDELDGAEDG